MNRAVYATVKEKQGRIEYVLIIMKSRNTLFN